MYRNAIPTYRIFVSTPRWRWVSIRCRRCAKIRLLGRELLVVGACHLSSVYTSMVTPPPKSKVLVGKLETLGENVEAPWDWWLMPLPFPSLWEHKSNSCVCEYQMIFDGFLPGNFPQNSIAKRYIHSKTQLKFSKRGVGPWWKTISSETHI